jgi:site-specific DNA recombinase
VYDFSLDADHDMADFEFLVGKIQKRANIRALTRGMQERARQGEWMGGRARLGYRLVPTGEIKNKRAVNSLVIDEEEANVVREIFHLFEKMNANAVARQLNRAGKLKPVKYPHRKVEPGKTHREWDGTSIVHVIRNELYAGWLTWGTGAWVKSRFMKGVEIQRHFRLDLQIIDQATFDLCQKLLKERSRPHVNNDHEIFAFTGLIRCPKCGGHMVGNNHERIRADGTVLSRTYVCYNRRRETDVCLHGQCYAESIISRGVLPFTSALLRQVVDRIREVLEVTAREMSEDVLRSHLEAELRAGISDCETQENNLARAVALGQIQSAQISTVSQELSEKKVRLKMELEKLLSQSAIEQEFQTALAELEGDLDEALFKIWKNNPLALNRILRFIYFDNVRFKVMLLG